MRFAPQGRALLGLFVLSGFSGLIYQSIWSHYLGLVLGHAAYAQTLVLGIFMGGMALGAWLASRHSARIRHLLLGYAAIELVIGVMGLLFHPVFEAYIGFSQDRVMPGLASPAAAHTYQWLSAALLIVPQCILLGATFPLMSAAYLRLRAASDGEVLGGLYFTNSLGAAFGALAAAFLLLPVMGMPGAMLTAGLLNVLVALATWAVWKSLSETPAIGSAPEIDGASEDHAPRPLVRFLLACAFVTGATSFVYEIGWVRMLNMALGSTIHSFELMLAAFILGLAGGGLWVRQRTARIEDAVRAAGWAQVLMGVFALLSVVMFTQSFRGIEWLMGALQRNDSGYDAFIGGSALAALLVMFPAAFFAGMTLPLFTMALLRAGGNERRIGQVYASNTLGAIVGVALTVHALVPLMGVRTAIIVSALADAVVGVMLLARASPWPVRRLAGAVGMTIAALAAALGLGRMDPRVLVSGVYRTGSSDWAKGTQIHYLRDGKAATVSVLGTEGTARVIGTNGKTDAGLVLDINKPPSPDEITMMMAGVLPLVLHPDPGHIAVIGWGSGLTTHTLVGSKKPRRVETIEIEPAMVEGARQFGARVARAYTDPRSKLLIDDARTHFAMGNRKYDVIVSEPSNPWVSGVAGLFTHEFYRFLRSHLRPGGMLVQWIQAYELDGALLATMLAALLQEFPDSEIYVTNSNDYLVVARTGAHAMPDAGVLAAEPLRSELARVGLRSLTDIELRRVGSAAMLRAYIASYGAQPHSDYYPTVSLNAPRSRFKRMTAVELLDTVDSGMPIAEMLDSRRTPGLPEVTKNSYNRFAYRKYTAYALAQRLKGDPEPPPYDGALSPLAELQALQQLSRHRVSDGELKAWTQYAADVASETLSDLTSTELEGVWIQPAWIDIGDQPELVVDTMAALEAAALRDPARMRSSAVKLLEAPPESMSGALRGLMLTQAQLATLAMGNPRDALALHERFGASSGAENYVRRFLRAWAQTSGGKSGAP